MPVRNLNLAGSDHSVGRSLIVLVSSVGTLQLDVMNGGRACANPIIAF